MEIGFQSVRGVLFDLDNTLLDRDRTFLAWARWFVHERLHLEGDEERSRAVDLLVELDAKGYGSKQTLFETMKNRYPTLTVKVEDLMADFYEEHAEFLSLETETSRLLDQLDSAQLPWGIVTNGTSNQLLKLEKMGLDKRTSCIFVSEIVGSWKPDRVIFLRALECIGVAPESTLFIGDNAEADIAGAANVGMLTAWLSLGREWPVELPCKPTIVLESLDEASRYLPNRILGSGLP